MARRVAERADDSVLYLYAVTKSGAGDPPQLRGVDGQARIEAIACAGLTCWISGRPRLAGSSKRPPPASGCRDCRIPRHIASPSGHSFSQRSIS